jgi:hypothetical protein
MDADAELTDSLATLRAWSASMTVARRGTRGFGFHGAGPRPAFMSSNARALDISSEPLASRSCSKRRLGLDSVIPHRLKYKRFSR